MTNCVLPDSWLKASLGEVVDYGKTIKAEPSEVSDETWVLELEDIEKDSSKVLQRLTFAERKSKSTKNRFNSGDVLYGKLRPYLNKVVVADSDGVCSTEIVPLQTSKYLDNRYLFYWVKHPEFLAYVTKVGYGVNMPRLGTKDGKAAPFVLAPLAEQKQIAAKLDELLAQVDTLKTRLDAIPAILKRFRQSVLAAAVSGRLTEEWREGDEYYTSRSGRDWKWGDIPVDWLEKYYSELVESRLGKMLDKSKNTGVPTKYLGNINVRWFEFELSNLQEILVSEQEQLELSVKPGDVLICEGGEPGRSAIWQAKSEVPIVFQKALHRARVHENILPQWLVYNLKNDADNRTLENLFTGTTIKHLTGKALKNYPLRVPPIKEQREIIHQVEQFFTFADQIEQRVKDAQSRVNHLTQSILAKAFRGELTTEWREQNSNLISGDNSAEALLHRIAEERKVAAQTKSKRTQSKRKKNMTKLSVDALKESLLSMDADEFTFDQIREQVSGEYELLKSLLFQLLSEKTPAIKQVFNNETKQIVFQKV